MPKAVSGQWASGAQFPDCGPTIRASRPATNGTATGVNFPMEMLGFRSALGFGSFIADNATLSFGWQPDHPVSSEGAESFGPFSTNTIVTPNQNLYRVRKFGLLDVCLYFG